MRLSSRWPFLRLRPRHSREWERHLSLRALTELRENEDADEGEGRGAFAWVLLSLLVFGLAASVYSAIALH